MSEKHPAWTRKRVGRNRVHWVAYDDRADSPDRRIIDQGYATTLPEADAAAKAALADAGLYQARRLSNSFGQSRPKPPVEQSDRPTKPAARVQTRPREYLYTRLHSESDESPLIAAHLVVKKTAKRVYVTRKTIGPDQIGTDDESWGLDERTIALDRTKLEREGSVYSSSHRHSDFYVSRDAAVGDRCLETPIPLHGLGHQERLSSPSQASSPRPGGNPGRLPGRRSRLSAVAPRGPGDGRLI
jgi:hypothetical protein